jgi:hypothetical protein
VGFEESVMRAAFYCISSRIYFLGAVGLVNSLRLIGHTEPIYLLDCGLDREQRELLGSHVTLVPAPPLPPDAEPFLLKPVAPLAHPAEVMVLIDADMIVTRPLTDLVDRASDGRVVAFRNNTDRFVPEWGELLGLGQAERRPYLSSGLVLLERSLGTRLLRLMDEHRGSVDFERTFWRGNDREYPFLYADQDLLNAILATTVEPDRILALEHRLAATPPFRGLRLRDARTLRCAYGDGSEPYVVHQYVRKPWLERTYHGIYSRLLARLLLGPDVAVKVPTEQVPLRMRDGLHARVERARVNVIDFLRWRYGDRVPQPIAPRVEAVRRRLRSGGPS